MRRRNQRHPEKRKSVSSGDGDWFRQCVAAALASLRNRRIVAITARAEQRLPSGRPARAMAMCLTARKSSGQDKRGSANPRSVTKSATWHRPDSDVGREHDRQGHDGMNMATTVMRRTTAHYQSLSLTRAGKAALPRAAFPVRRISTRPTQREGRPLSS
jgi:hypothetical protein